MKFLPLVWAALDSKPARAVLTLLSVTVAFTVFGLMIGLNATIDAMADRPAPTASLPGRVMTRARPSQWRTRSQPCPASRRQRD